jgi:general secretion pathway protein D
MVRGTVNWPATAPTTPATATAAAGNAPAAAPAQPQTVSAGRALIVDEPRNALIFQGDPAEWERLLPLIRQMDKEARQVMIEMTIAEVTLDDNEEFGVNWFAKSGLGRFGGKFNFGTLPAAATGGPGLSYLLDVAGESRALLKAFGEDSRVSILSTPRLMVKSGEEASIDVGTEVPTITARQTSPQQVEGNTGLLQSIQYRKTGIILSVKPTVYSDDRVDIELSQEVSEALPLSDADTTGSPSIFNRSVKTSLSLRDGGSIVLGGLMSNRQTNSDNGIPYLKQVPLVGNLFKSQSKKKNKTELVIMIVPYIVGSDQRAQELTRAIGDNLELLQLPKALAPGDTMAAPQPRGAVTVPLAPATSP